VYSIYVLSPIGVFEAGRKCFDVFCVIKVTGVLCDACYHPCVYLEVVERVYMYACYLLWVYLEVLECVYMYGMHVISAWCTCRWLNVYVFMCFISHSFIWRWLTVYLHIFVCLISHGWLNPTWQNMTGGGGLVTASLGTISVIWVPVCIRHPFVKDYPW